MSAGSIKGEGTCGVNPKGRNRRTVWEVVPTHYRGAHFATFPPKLIEPCVLAGSRVGDVVFDPFTGAGTTGLVANRHGRMFVGTELSKQYAQIAIDRIASECSPEAGESVAKTFARSAAESFGTKLGEELGEWLARRRLGKTGEEPEENNE